MSAQPNAARRPFHQARSALDAGLRVSPRDQVPLPNSRDDRELVARFTDAFEGGDVEGVVALLTGDAWLTMPPAPLEYQGPAAIGRFLSSVPAGGRLDLFRLVPTRANGQPAFGCYLRDPPEDSSLCEEPAPGTQWVPEVSKRAGRYGLPGDAARRCAAVSYVCRGFAAKAGPPW